MVFSELHWVPSVLAAVFTILQLFVKDKKKHKALGYGMVVFALVGLVGYISQGNFNLFNLDFDTIHAWISIAALLLSLYLFIDGAFFKNGQSLHHYRLGYLTAVFSFLALLTGALLLGGLVNLQPSGFPTLQVATSSTLPEVEAKEFQGLELTPLSQQRSTEISGTQYLDRNSYRLSVTGLVENNLNYSYDDLLTLPAYTEVVYMLCVEGWGYTAKWTGFRLIDLLDIAGLKSNATYIVFRCSDGYTTGLPLSYLRGNQTLIAYGINDVTLPPEHGFPARLVAVNKYGYKWAKWITTIEVGDKVVQGYWESWGYSNDGDIRRPLSG